MAEDVISQRSAAQRNSIAFQYMREQVAREMSMLYALLGREPSQATPQRPQVEIVRRSRKAARARR